MNVNCCYCYSILSKILYKIVSNKEIKNLINGLLFYINY